MTLIGVDLGTRKVTIAVFTEGDSGHRLYWTETFEVEEEIPRGHVLLALARYVHDEAISYSADQVWVEDVIVGNNRKYSIQLAQVLGAVMAQLARIKGLDQRVVDNKAWKREIVGNGNASKDMVREYIHVTHPDYALLCGEDQDSYDATCIGLYGIRITARALKLHLASE